MKDGAKEFISADLAMMFRVLKDNFGMQQDKAIEAVYEVIDGVKVAWRQERCLSYVLITTAPGKVNQVLRKVKGLPIIREAYVVTGIYDIIAALKTQDIKELKEVVTENIHKFGGIDATATSLVVT